MQITIFDQPKKKKYQPNHRLHYNNNDTIITFHRSLQLPQPEEYQKQYQHSKSFQSITQFYQFLKIP